MCYVLLLSTTSNEDLTAHNNELVRFARELPRLAEAAKLKYPNKWYIGSKSGCSCSFRHLYSIELGFGEPVEWYEEASEELEATTQLIQIIRDLVINGQQVDCIDLWENQEMQLMVQDELEVDLSKIKDSEFRFFENYHFIFSATTL